MRSRSLSPHGGRYVWPVAASTSLFAIGVLSLVPADAITRTGAPGVVEHIVAYAGSAGLATCAWRRRVRPASISLAYVGLAAVLECLQRYSPGRSSDLVTFLAGAAGAAVGVLVAERLVRAIGRAGWRAESEAT